MINIGLIGCGYWGKNYLKTLRQMDEVRLRGVFNRKKVISGEELPEGCSFTTDSHEILEDEQIDAVVIATPPHTHYSLAIEALKNGKDVLIEKPVTCNSHLARALSKFAEHKNRVFMVGHIFLYNPAIRKLKEVVERKEFGKMLYMYSRRVSLGPIREDVSSMWNLAPHDVSIMNYLTGTVPRAVTATGSSFLKQGIEDVVDLSLAYDGNVSGFAHVSWLEPEKSREIIVIGEGRTAHFNDLEDKKLKIFKKEDLEEVVECRTGTTPLREQCLHFLECVRERKKPFTDGFDGYVVTRVLECAQISIGLGKYKNIDYEY